MKIVSFHTEGPYEKEAARLFRSLELLGLTEIYDSETIPEIEWWSAVIYKSLFIKQMILKHQCPILCVDADAIFHKNPVPYFTKLAEEGFLFAMYKRHWWQTGTAWINPAPESIALLDAWMMNVLKHKLLFPDEQRGDTQNFNEIMTDKDYDWFKKLPPEFCWFDMLEKCEEEIVIEHLQASRENRKPQISTELLRNRRTKRLIEIDQKLGL